MIKYLSKILFIVGEQKKKLFILVASFLFVSTLETFGIGLIGPFVSLATEPSVILQSPILEWLYNISGLENQKYFVAFSGFLVIIVFLIKSFASWRVQTYTFTFSCQQQVRLRAGLMHAYLEAPYTFHLRKSSSDAINSMLSESNFFCNNVLIPLLNLIANTVVVILLGILLGITSPIAVLAILILALPLVLLLGYFRNSIAKWGKEASQANKSIIQTVNHGLGGIKETKVLGCGSYFESQLVSQAQKFANASSSFYAFRLSPRIIIENLLIVFLVGFTSTFLILNQDVTKLTSVLSVFAVASIRLIPAASNITTGIGTLRNRIYTVNKLYADLRELEIQGLDFQSLNLTSEQLTNSLDKNNCLLEENSNPRQVAEFTTNIAIDNITYNYPGVSEAALKNLSLNIPKGESIGLIGKSGAGKTTLVDVVLGLLKPQSGDIKVDGLSIYEDLRAWQNLIAYIPQSIFLIEDTIEHNIAFGVSDNLIDSTLLNEVIRAAQLEEFIQNLDDGVCTMVGERGVRLSGGQRQRIGIARALYHKREILVLDEATAALDNQTESLVSDAIAKLSGEKTTIIIAHRLSTVEHCDRIYALEQGEISKSGSYQEVVLGQNKLSQH